MGQNLPIAQTVLLIKAAALLSVPVIGVLYPEAPGSSVLYSSRSEPNMPTPITFAPAVANWSETPLGQAVAAPGRTQVVLCGLWLDEAMTLLAFNCLAVGFDIHIVIDATAALDIEHVPAAYARLAQAGAVPIATAHVVREWAAQSSSAAAAKALLALLPDNRTNLL